MTSTTLQTQTISSGDIVYTRQMVTELQRTFTPPRLRPGATIDEIMYAAGQQSVIEHITQRINSATSALMLKS